VLQEIHEQHLIVRTAWLYGIQGGNFVRTMLRVGKEREELRVVADQKGCPTWAGDLAEALLELVTALQTDTNLSWGTYHYCGTGVTSWFDFAAEIFRIANRYEAYPVQVSPISTEEFPTPARRPAYSVLDCSKIERVFGIRPRPWKESLSEVLRQLLG
jgi:dTDP-4-dehydrorhamnose reductase